MPMIAVGLTLIFGVLLVGQIFSSANTNYSGFYEGCKVIKVKKSRYKADCPSEDMEQTAINEFLKANHLSISSFSIK